MTPDELAVRKAAIDNYDACMLRSHFRFRFAVGDPEHNFSTRWTAWGSNTDFYIASPPLGITKVSLHRFQYCQVAIEGSLIEKRKEKGLPVPVDRALTKWHRKPLSDAGAVVHVASVLFPTNHLKNTTVPRSTEKEPLFLIEPAPPGSAVEFGFFYSREAAKILEPRLQRLGRPLIRVTLDDGDSVSIVIRQRPFDSPLLLSAGRQLKGIMNADIPVSTERSVTAAVWNDPDEDGTSCLRIVEVGGVVVRRNS